MPRVHLKHPFFGGRFAVSLFYSVVLLSSVPGIVSVHVFNSLPDGKVETIFVLARFPTQRVRYIRHVHTSTHNPTLSFISPWFLSKMFGRISVAFIVVTLAALFCGVEAVKGPKITHKVYFDIEHGGESLGRSECRVPFLRCSVLLNVVVFNFSYHGSLWRREWPVVAAYLVRLPDARLDRPQDC